MQAEEYNPFYSVYTLRMIDFYQHIKENTLKKNDIYIKNFFNYIKGLSLGKLCMTIQFMKNYLPKGLKILFPKSRLQQNLKKILKYINNNSSDLYDGNVKKYINMLRDHGKDYTDSIYQSKINFLYKLLKMIKYENIIHTKLNIDDKTLPTIKYPTPKSIIYDRLIINKLKEVDNISAKQIIIQFASKKHTKPLTLEFNYTTSIDILNKIDLTNIVYLFFHGSIVGEFNDLQLIIKNLKLKKLKITLENIIFDPIEPNEVLLIIPDTLTNLHLTGCNEKIKKLIITKEHEHEKIDGEEIHVYIKLTDMGEVENKTVYGFNIKIKSLTLENTCNINFILGKEKTSLKELIIRNNFINFKEMEEHLKEDIKYTKLIILENYIYKEEEESDIDLYTINFQQLIVILLNKMSVESENNVESEYNVDLDYYNFYLTDEIFSRLLEKYRETTIKLNTIKLTLNTISPVDFMDIIRKPIIKKNNVEHDGYKKKNIEESEMYDMIYKIIKNVSPNDVSNDGGGGGGGAAGRGDGGDVLGENIFYKEVGEGDGGEPYYKFVKCGYDREDI
jgi:hypothetical protein